MRVVLTTLGPMQASEEELDQTFQRWYPGFRKLHDHLNKAAYFRQICILSCQGWHSALVLNQTRNNFSYLHS